MTVATTLVSKIDLAIEDKLDPIRRIPGIDKAMYMVTESANHSLVWHIVNAVRLAFDHETKKSDAVHLAATLALESALVNGPIKRTFRRTRPVHDIAHPHRLRKPMTTSFPSGHTTSAFCAAVVLSRSRSPKQRATWYGLATVIAYSRVHVRLHHPSDVICGALLGYALGRIACEVFGPD